MPAEGLDGEALRRAAVGAAVDGAVRAMLEAAEVDAAARGEPWAASHGAVQGYAVTVGLCAEDLGLVARSPATRDLLERAFALAVASAPHRAMVAFAVRWSGHAHALAHSYRDVAHHAVPIALDEALRRFLSAAGEPAAPAGLTLALAREAGAVRAHAGDGVDRAERRRIERALGALLGEGVHVQWTSH